MKQQNLFEAVPITRLQTLSRDDLIEFITLQQQVNETIIKDNERLRALNNELEQKTLLIDDKYIVLKNKFFGKSSEKSPTSGDEIAPAKEAKNKKTKVQLPSLRYPDAPLIERHVEFKDLPNCKCCGVQMLDSGMTEDSEFLTVIPAQFFVVRQKRHKYRCGKCHGDIQTAPSPPKIKSGSSYSDEMVVDVALSKYCDLIPVERYASIAGRGGLEDLPTQSLIEGTHNLADFLKPTYAQIKDEANADKVLHADETTHRMLEGDKTPNWYLWGFSNKKASYFELHGTRSGVVASDFLAESNCEFLMSDVFSGYGKAVRDANVIRKNKNLPLIQNIYCNAHARRRFKEAGDAFPDEAKFFIDQYKEIYRLNSESKDKPPDEILRIRGQMPVIFESMKNRVIANIGGYSKKSSIGKAMGYFLRNYDEFTRFITNEILPIDNNPQESLLRNPVIGRKTWYGTHSKRGAATAAILFSIIETCKLNHVNPREYVRALVQDLHAGKQSYTPSQFKATLASVNVG